MGELEIFKYFTEINNLKSDICIEESLENICKEILLYTQSNGVFILLYDNEKSILKPYINIGKNKEYDFGKTTIPVSNEDLNQIMNNKSLSNIFKVKLNSLKHNKVELNDLDEDALYVGYYKIIVDEEFIGTFNVVFENNIEAKSYTEGSEFIKFISKMIGIVIKNFRLYEQLQIENQKRIMLEIQLDNYFDMSADLVSVYELEGSVSKMSSSWENLLGWSADEINTLSSFKLIHKDDHQTLKSLNDYLIKDGQIIHDRAKTTLRYLCKDGTYKYIAWTIQYIKNSNVFISMGKDMTDIMATQEKNKKLEKNISTEIIKNEFFTNMSHELKTPLNILLSTIQVMQRNIDNDYIIKANLENHLGKLRQNSYRLLRLVTNIIDMNKIDIGSYAMDRSNNNIIGVIEDITMSVVDYMQSKNIELIFDTDKEEVITSCNQDAIERVMLNLLSNAIKYVPKEKGKIFVNIKSDDKKVRVSVKDNGIGISKDKINLIFERFKQINTGLFDAYSGSGIGLYLVKSLIELQGGTISVNSEVDKGTEFVFELPIVIKDEEESISKPVDRRDIFVEKCNIEFCDIYK